MQWVVTQPSYKCMFEFYGSSHPHLNLKGLTLVMHSSIITRTFKKWLNKLKENEPTPKTPWSLLKLQTLYFRLSCATTQVWSWASFLKLALSSLSLHYSECYSVPSIHWTLPQSCAPLSSGAKTGVSFVYWFVCLKSWSDFSSWSLSPFSMNNSLFALARRVTHLLSLGTIT